MRKDDSLAAAKKLNTSEGNPGYLFSSSNSAFASFKSAVSKLEHQRRHARLLIAGQADEEVGAQRSSDFTRYILPDASSAHAANNFANQETISQTMISVLAAGYPVGLLRPDPLDYVIPIQQFHRRDGSVQPEDA